MGTVIEVGFSGFIAGARNLYEQGQITLEQYAGCLRRAGERRENRKWSFKRT